MQKRTRRVFLSFYIIVIIIIFNGWAIEQKGKEKRDCDREWSDLALKGMERAGLHFLFLSKTKKEVDCVFFHSVLLQVKQARKRKEKRRKKEEKTGKRQEQREQVWGRLHQKPSTTTLLFLFCGHSHHLELDLVANKPRF